MSEEDDSPTPRGRVPGRAVVFVMIGVVSAFCAFLAWLTWDAVMIRVNQFQDWLTR